MFNNLIGKNKELGRFLFCERYTLPPVKNAMYIAEGQDLKRGAVVDVNGVLVGTNSLMPYAVLEFDCDTRSGGKEASVFIKGEFNFDKLHFADGLDQSDLDNIVYNGNGLGIVIKPYEYAEGFSPLMVPTGTSQSNPLMNAEETERMINAMKPIDDMTLRFEFSKKDYNPETAGVGSAGTWTKVDSPTLNVWDWTNDETDWHESFMGAFPDADNEVSVIAAGDTSSVTTFRKLFAGTHTGIIGQSSYVLTARNNIIKCVPFDVSSATSTHSCFAASALQEVVKFDYSNAEYCDARYAFADSFVHDFDEIELYVTQCLSMFAMCYNLVHVGKIKFDPEKIKNTGLQEKEISLFNVGSALQPMNIETIEGIEGLGLTFSFESFFVRLRNLKRIREPLDCSSLEYIVATFQNNEKLEEFPEFYNIGEGKLKSIYLSFQNCKKIKELPAIDTSNVTDASIAFAGCTSIERIPDYDFSSVTSVRRCFDGCRNVKYGILETYNKFLARGASITNHTDCFKDCGIDTPEGRAALAQIPQSWGGLAEG